QHAFPRPIDQAQPVPRDQCILKHAVAPDGHTNVGREGPHVVLERLAPLSLYPVSFPSSSPHTALATDVWSYYSRFQAEGKRIGEREKGEDVGGGETYEAGDARLAVDVDPVLARLCIKVL